MDKKSFDLTISFDKAEYLNPQLRMMVNTLKKNIPKETILHITTNRDDDDPTLKWIQTQVPTKIYKKPPFDFLKSRCQYMFHCFEIETDKPWVIKTEIDVLFLRKLREFNQTLDDDCDIILQSENRRIFQSDNFEDRVWRNIYKQLEVPLPDIKLPYVENNEIGRPLLATGVVCVKSEHLKYIDRNWIPMIMLCEKWMNMGIHPNEFAFTAMIFKAGWDFKLFSPKYNFNPIGHFRKGAFPSTELIENCKIPEEVLVFDYHRPQWLMHCAKYNPKIADIIKENKDSIPKDWWTIPKEYFMEK